MKIKLVFEDWRKDSKSVLSTEEGIDLVLGSFHPGSIFSAHLDISPDDEIQLKEAISNGFEPVFAIYNYE